MSSVVEVLVSGGRATPGPPVGPALGPLGVNIKAVVDEINKATNAYDGMQVPVKIVVDDAKNFTIEVGTPPTSALILSELGVSKGASLPGSEVVGDVKIDQLVKISEMKREKLLSYTTRDRVKEIIGTCKTLGVTVEGMSPKEAVKAIDRGEFDKALQA
ncbi:50S ribosomal protein L11 [Candidatus Methanoperedenaceae archaeon GB50]|nr:50S ribosomal protein L11 [Candidatus Methanoperedenaceae archaeon GB37]CAD7771081.1 50S ribosomal protein L11 [Candidatus Methanoperedenaceae archaeon GB50]CAD7778973.1 MAG: 50S ribosomal protein L11 [Candidatus Methanoperedenaceae archaeon GB50]